jgi:hypothetical protein
VRIGLSVAPADLAELTKQADGASVTDYVYRLVLATAGAQDQRRAASISAKGGNP